MIAGNPCKVLRIARVDGEGVEHEDLYVFFDDAEARTYRDTIIDAPPEGTAAMVAQIVPATMFLPSKTH